MASLCAVRLLQQFPECAQLPFRCVCFAVPSIGNHQLRARCEQAGWDRYLSNYLLPGVLTAALG